MNGIIEKAMRQAGALDKNEIVSLLSMEDTKELFTSAYQLKCRYIGKRVSLRGLIEMGNLCAKDCYYCGIRKSNSHVTRYHLDEEDVIRMAKWCFEHDYGSVVLQSGEIESESNTMSIERILRGIREFGGDAFGVTLCLGEQTEEVFRRWREAGAHRYLLRIESSVPSLYAKIHPADHLYERRVECLLILKRLGYQTGSGVMTGLPGQSLDDLAHDIEFYKEMDLDMIGMGPYLPHAETPLGANIAMTPEYISKQLQLGLKMIAITRLYLHDVNIAATTALQALDDRGREMGIQAGANVIMPNVTDVEYRSNYQLYPNKPCMDENAAKCRNCLNWRMISIGEKIIWGERGDSPHYFKNKQ